MNLDTLKNAVQSSISQVDYQNITAAVVVLAFFLIIGKLLKKLLTRAFSKTKLDKAIQKVIMNVLRTVYGIITAVAVFSEMGFDTRSLVAVISIISLGFALAANDMLSDVAGGIVMLTTRPFWVGDYIACEDVEGKVEEIHLNHTKLHTIEGIIITVPNKILASSKVQNYTRSGKRRLDIKAYTSYDVPEQKTRKVLMDLMKSYDKVLQDPAPMVYLTDYRESDLEYTMYCWVRSFDYLKMKWEITQGILHVFRENDIEITYNHLNIHMIEPAKAEDRNQQKPTETEIGK